MIKAALILCLAMMIAFAAFGEPLCIDGRPAPRRPDVTYGGLPPIRGMVRDHIVPLCLGGPDGAANIQYQTLPDGYKKDAKERAMCEAYCSGIIGIDDARNYFSSGEWRTH